MQFSFGVEAWLAEANASHLITEMQKLGHDAQPRYFEISWNLICNDAGLVERVLVAVRDVTLLRSLKQTAREKERESDIIAQVLESGLEAFEEFAALGKRLLSENAADLGDASFLLPVWLLHFAICTRSRATPAYRATLTSSMPCIPRKTLTVRCVKIQRQRWRFASSRPRLRRCVPRSGNTRTFAAASSRSSPSHETTSADRVLQQVMALVEGADSLGGELVPRIRASLAALQGISLAELAAETGCFLPSLAAELGKPAPKVLANTGKLRLVPEWSSMLRDLLVQCYRNSLFHGLEMPEVRRKSSKDAQGRIELRAQRRGETLEIEVCDDGAGLALDVLRKRKPGGSDDDDTLAERIFEPGLSTAEEVGQIAGRGVGLDIVRSNLRGRGGDAVVRFVGEAKDGRRPFALVLVLPAKAVLGVSVGLDS